MNQVRRGLVVVFGLLVAIAAGLIFLPVAAALDPTTRRAGTDFVHFALYSIAETEFQGSPALAAAELTRFIWAAVVAVCVLPVTLAALIGEAARTRSILWYVGASGLVAAAGPWLARAAFHLERAATATPQELRFAVIFFLTGAFSGLVFWALAGRDRSDRAIQPN